MSRIGLFWIESVKGEKPFALKERNYTISDDSDTMLFLSDVSKLLKDKRVSGLHALCNGLCVELSDV